MDILIAEDDGTSLKLLNNILVKDGHRVLTATTGQHAWDIFQRETILMVITDWLLPEMSGLALCRNIRSSQKEHYTYIIVATGRNEKGDLVEVLKHGADDYILKPIHVEELRAKVKVGERISKLEKKHKDLAQCLIESRNKLRIVLDSLPEEIVTIDTNACIVSANTAFLKGKGTSFSQIAGAPCFDNRHWRMPAVNIANVQGHALDIFHSGAPRFVYETIAEPGRQKRHLEFHLLPVRDDSGTVHQVAIVSKDITDDLLKSEQIKSLNRELQKAVEEVQEKNAELVGTLSRLKETQSQILQSEKMASIGQLAAGVAHEINNPVGFVSSNLKTLTDYQQNIGQILSEYRQFIDTVSGPDDSGMDREALEALNARIQEKASELDIAYILEDIPGLIHESREGLDRIKKIVMDLKNFSHPGEDVLKLADINQNLESTLNIVWNELKYKATVTKDYGELPQVKCYPQQLNQVFMNLLVNAAQAIEKQGEIHIITCAAGGDVEIIVSDTGQGIDEKNLGRIFDPFFTTKEVGKGTGLGLNVTYNIIKKHHGAIDVRSEVGKGTTFTIRIPAGGPPALTSEP
jgi:PAS domain S-box-containing protein